MSATVKTGKSMLHGCPVSGLVVDGPVVPRQPPSTLAQITKYRSVSKTRPGPTTWLHHPARPVSGLVPATYWSPVRPWQIMMALERSAFSVP